MDSQLETIHAIFAKDLHMKDASISGDLMRQCGEAKQQHLLECLENLDGFISKATYLLAKTELSTSRQIFSGDLSIVFKRIGTNTYEASYNERVVRLSAFEKNLIDLFISRIYTVIPLDDIKPIFKERSIKGSSVRVRIYLLRLKLEQLTASKFTIESVHKCGYRLARA